ncbi:MAG: bifunctional acetate--CoA ligase family protein/GNAT family N-acetyltransferase [Desulfobacter sp.]|nr:MAG: bifunctional acetate--CoA ligase family protein/GNAT family N-acetyltransferase [Desulfobacter sp.]
MGTQNLLKMFSPGSVAVIGASEKKGRVGEALMQNLITGTFDGDIFPVNPNYSDIMGIPAAGSVLDLSGSVDLAVVAAPIIQVPQIIADCGEKGVAGAVVLSAGGKETGVKGREIEARIKAAARRTGIRIIGPNCVGMAHTQKGLNASFMQEFPLPGRIAFLSQSGAVCTSVLDLARREQVGFSHFVSLGSMLDVDFADMIDFLGSLKTVDSIIMYMENMTHVRNFMSAARAVSRVKPIICLKTGRSTAGARAAASHTGALAGEDAVYDAAFDRAGILRVDTFEALFDYTRILARQQRPRGRRLVIVTNAGGPGVMAVDALVACGLEPAELSPDTVAALDESIEKEWSRSNPVDLLGDVSPGQFIRAVDICARAPEVDGLLLIHSPVGIFRPVDLARPLAEFLKTVNCPVFTAWVGGTRMDEARRVLNEMGGVTYDAPEKAVRAFAGLYRYGRNIDFLHEIPVRRDINRKVDPAGAGRIIGGYLCDEGTFLSEADAKAVLSCYGIPVNRTLIAGSRADAVQRAGEIGFPVALKITSPDIVHKSDAGGVCLNLDSAGAVERAYDRMMETAAEAFPEARIHGVSVQAMVPSPEYEIIVGAKLDEQFGPVMVFGMGGVMTEIHRDTALALPPLNPALASRAVNATKISRVMEGFRQFKAVDPALAEDILIRVSRLVTDFPQIQALDINPLAVSRGQLVAVDARIRVRPTPVQSPDHLIISPYPAWQERSFTTADKDDIFIRPVRPEDAGAMMAFFERLSPRTVYYRFFSPLKQLSKEMLIRLTQIDYDREVALVAVSPPEPGEKIIGVARIIFAGGGAGEFAIMLADSWQGKGIGAALLKRCLAFARKAGLKRVYGLVLSENRQMLSLGKKLGFKRTVTPGTGEIELEIDMDTWN